MAVDAREAPERVEDRQLGVPPTEELWVDWGARPRPRWRVSAPGGGVWLVATVGATLAEVRATANAMAAARLRGGLGGLKTMETD